MKKVSREYDVVVVGAGISGATLAERYANIANKKVLVIEKRDHIGGNCYDFENEHGILVAKYGPHYFHTNDKGVWKYVNRFTRWVPYEHRVVSHVDNKKVPVPVNITTVNMIFGLRIKTERGMIAWLAKNTEKNPNPKNSEESALRRVGKVLYKKLFEGYTLKQWDKKPNELHPEVMDRIPVRTNFDDRYFTDKYQALPKKGYTKIFEKMLSHPNITVQLSTDWETAKKKLSGKEKVFFTGKVDSYFDEKLGKLEYRSLRFEFETLDMEFFQEKAQENQPSLDVPFTRIVEFKLATGQKHPKTTICREYPTWDGEPYYPVPSERNKKIHSRYQEKAATLEKKGIYFVGRLANYKYLNMDQAFRNSLDLFQRLNPKIKENFY